jgi:hypothetical protein
VRTAAETFVPNPRLDVAKVISELAVGEALVSTLQDKGVPMPVERAVICPPRCRMGALTDGERQAVLAQSLLGAKYDRAIDRESAHEVLNRRVPAEPASVPAGSEKPGKQEPGFLQDILFGNGRRQGILQAEAKYQARKFVRGLLGTLLGGRR